MRFRVYRLAHVFRYAAKVMCGAGNVLVGLRSAHVRTIARGASSRHLCRGDRSGRDGLARRDAPELADFQPAAIVADLNLTPAAATIAATDAPDHAGFQPGD